MNPILRTLLVLIFSLAYTFLPSQTMATKPASAIKPDPACGSPITDSRDGRTYATVRIGTQCWMSQNLNFGTYVPVGQTQGAEGTQKYCYGDDSSKCDIKGYGGLYEWKEMMGTSQPCNGAGAAQPTCDKPAQGICPVGWHIPSHDEYTLLEKSVGSNPNAFPYDNITRGFFGSNEGANLKSTEFGPLAPSWYNGGTGPLRGTNTSGFNALQSGAVQEGVFSGLGYFGCWLWTSSEFSETAAWRRMVYYNFAMVNRNAASKTSGISVRCIKDETH